MQVVKRLLVIQARRVLVSILQKYSLTCSCLGLETTLQAPDILLTLFVDHITGRPRLDKACEGSGISFKMCRNAPPPQLRGARKPDAGGLN